MEKKVILFQGDSITDAGRDKNNPADSGRGYPHLVQAEMGYLEPDRYEFYNRGISGNRVVDVYARMKRDIINLKPDYMSILIGVNDVWHDFAASPNGVDVEKYEMVYDLLIGELREKLPDMKIMIMEPYVLYGIATADNEDFPDKWKGFSTEVPKRAAAARRIAEKYSLKFVPLQSVLDEASKKVDRDDYWTRDGVHPTPYGHELIKREWLKAFNEIK